MTERTILKHIQLNCKKKTNVSDYYYCNYPIFFNRFVDEGIRTVWEVEPLPSDNGVFKSFLNGGDLIN